MPASLPEWITDLVTSADPPAYYLAHAAEHAEGHGAKCCCCPRAARPQHGKTTDEIHEQAEDRQKQGHGDDEARCPVVAHPWALASSESPDHRSSGPAPRDAGADAATGVVKLNRLELVRRERQGARNKTARSWFDFVIDGCSLHDRLDLDDKTASVGERQLRRVGRELGEGEGGGERRAARAVHRRVTAAVRQARVDTDRP